MIVIVTVLSWKQVTYEGRRLTRQDIRHITQPRDELILHSEVGVRAGRELCRWASKARQQQDQCLIRRLQQAQSHEAALTAEVRQLREKLDRICKWALSYLWTYSFVTYQKHL